MSPDRSRRAQFPDDRVLTGERVALRCVTESDCRPRYVAWLNDPVVNRYLETRWRRQDPGSVLAFVRSARANPAVYLLAIIERASGEHIGNIKLGPVDRVHGCADVSYFVGDRSRWGTGCATDAIRTVVRFAFEECGLHRVQAGVHETNVASARALEKAGFRREGVWRRRLRGDDGWEDHVWFGILADESPGEGA